MDIEKIKLKLSNFGIKYEDYKDLTLIGKFKIPPKQKILNPDLKEEEAFYLLANIVFETCDGFVNQIPSLINLGDYDEWKKMVGKFRALNFQKAVYEEIKYRSLSNQLPELANVSFLTSNSVNLIDNIRDLNYYADLLNFISQNYLIQSDWQLLSIPAEELVFLPDLKEFIEKKINELDCELKKIIDQKQNKLSDQQLINLNEIPNIEQKLENNSKNIVSLSKEKQDKEDKNLKTDNKTIIGAINELNQDSYLKANHAGQLFVDTKKLPEFSKFVAWDKNAKPVPGIFKAAEKDEEVTILGQVKIKQDKEDKNLKTDNKTIIGAINELQKEVSTLTPPDITKAEFEKAIKEINEKINNQTIKEWYEIAGNISNPEFNFLLNNDINIKIKTENNRTIGFLKPFLNYNAGFYLIDVSYPDSGGNKSININEHSFNRYDGNVTSYYGTIDYNSRVTSRYEIQKISKIGFWMTKHEKDQFDKLS